MLDHKLKILLLEDSPADAELIQHQLKKNNFLFSAKVVVTRNDFEKSIKVFKPDIVLSDHSLPQFSSMEALEIARKLIPEIPFILVTGSVSEEFAVDCMKAGVDDYILKTSLIRLPSAIDNIFSQKKVKKEKEVIESLHAELKVAYKKIEESNKSIKDSINYARLIQQSILPDKEIVRKIFPQSFIFYKPKDIISGDFYWFAERDNKLIVAAADCTGHGVPGALMSMVGCSLLNEIVTTKGVTRPADILKKLNKGLVKTFKQDSKESRSGDGMDIALCTIDIAKNKIEYAGANRHLYHFKNKQLDQIKGNKFGLSSTEQNQNEFNNHIISYQAGDTIYLFTDGFADQFGGAKDKRIMTRNLVRLLQNTLSFDILKQAQLLEKWLMEWKGELEQTDDVLLIGIRL